LITCPRKTSTRSKPRLDHHWSHRDLAKAIKKVSGLYRNQDCWRRLCKGDTREPNRLTQHALDKFLSSELANGKKSRRVA
jgi:hypothetical protein